MAVYKSIKGSSKSLAGVKKILLYVGKEKKEERVFQTTGLNIRDDCEKAFLDMCRTKEIFQKTKGRQYKHHIQSFSPGEISPELAHKIGVEFCQKNFENFDIFVATHIDKDHVHNHFIINSVNNCDGKKIDEICKKQFKSKHGILQKHEIYLESLKKESDSFCLKYNLSVINRENNPTSLNIYNKKEYHIIKKHIEKKQESYKIQLAINIKNIARNSISKEDFIQELRNKNIEVSWTETQKNITFHFHCDSRKKSIRLSNLYNSFNQEYIFTKEGLEHEFREVSKQRAERLLDGKIQFIREKIPKIGGKIREERAGGTRGITEYSRASKKTNNGRLGITATNWIGISHQLKVSRDEHNDSEIRSISEIAKDIRENNERNQFKPNGRTRKTTNKDGLQNKRKISGFERE